MYRNCTACHKPRTERRPRAFYKSPEYKREVRERKALEAGREFRPSGPGGRGPGRGPRVEPTADQIESGRLIAWTMCIQMLHNQPDIDRAWSESYVRRRRARWVASRQARRGREKSQSDGTLTTDAVARLFDAVDDCAHCGASLTRRNGRRRYLPTDATLDHVIPLSRGGIHGVSNVVIACAACNFGRHDKLLDEVGPLPLGPGTAKNQ